MATNKWQKRLMKVKGWMVRMASYLMLRYTRWNAAKLREEITRRHIDRLHVGCGLVLLKDWLNVLYEPRQEYGKIKDFDGCLRLNYNLLKPWPVDDNTMRFIAGSHFIEHLDLNAGIAFLKESFRVMKPGGVIRLSCPDLETYADNYVKRDAAFFRNAKIQEWCAFDQARTPGEILAAKAYDSGGSHRWFYDFESLKHILEQAGFRDAKKCGRLEGRMPDLESIELADRELETVYVEAVKH